MLKSLILAFAVSAASGASLLSSPKREGFSSSPYLICSLTYIPQQTGVFGSYEYDDGNGVGTETIEVHYDEYGYYLPNDASEIYCNLDVHDFVLEISVNLSELGLNYISSYSGFDGYEKDATSAFFYFYYDRQDDSEIQFSFELVHASPIDLDLTLINCQMEGGTAPIPGENLEITIRANSDYGFPDSVTIVTSGTGYDEVTLTYSSPLTGGYGLNEYVYLVFTNVTYSFSARIEATNIEIWKVAYQYGYDDGISGPTADAYEQGYRTGEQVGYSNGYAEGKRDYQAGGIWSWFESAAVVLSSFLNIPIFPSFTIGMLVGALVGLSIILFFVRAFLFKG